MIDYIELSILLRNINIKIDLSIWDWEYYNLLTSPPRDLKI